MYIRNRIFWHSLPACCLARNYNFIEETLILETTLQETLRLSFRLSMTEHIVITKEEQACNQDSVTTFMNKIGDLLKDRNILDLEETVKQLNKRTRQLKKKIRTV